MRGLGTKELTAFSAVNLPSGLYYEYKSSIAALTSLHIYQRSQSFKKDFCRVTPAPRSIHSRENSSQNLLIKIDEISIMASTGHSKVCRKAA